MSNLNVLNLRIRCICSGIRLHDQDMANHIFRTCCALHNMLLDIDGLSEPWNSEGFDAEEYAGLPLHTIRARLSDEAIAAVLQAKFGQEEYVPTAATDDEQKREDPRQTASYESFRDALIAHFNYRWSLPRDHPDAIFWPRSSSYRADNPIL